MKKRLTNIFSLLFFFLFLGNSFAQNAKLFSVKQNEKWGLLNEAKKIVVPCEYDRIGEVRKNLCSVLLKGKWGLIDTTNRTVLPFEYDKLTFFNDTLLIASVKGNKKCLRLNNTLFISQIFEDLELFNDSIFSLYYQHKIALFDYKNRLRLDFKYSSIEAKGNLFVAYNNDSAFILNAAFKEIYSCAKDDEPAIVGSCFFIENERSYKVYSGKDGNLIDTTLFTNYGALSKGVVKLTKGKHFKYVVGIYQPELASYAFTENEQKYGDSLIIFGDAYIGMISLRGKILLDKKFSSIEITPYGFARAKNEDGVALYSAYDGRMIIKGNFDRIDFYNNGCVVVYEKGEKGLFNSRGDTLLPVGFEEIYVSNTQVKAVNEKSLTMATITANAKLKDKQEFNNVSFLNISADNAGLIDNWQANSANSIAGSINMANRWYRDEKSQLWGLKTPQDSIMIKPSFLNIQILDSVFTIVETKIDSRGVRHQLKEKFTTGKLFAVINTARGKYVLPPLYASIDASSYSVSKLLRVIPDNSALGAEVISLKKIKKKKKCLYAGSLIENRMRFCESGEFDFYSPNDDISLGLSKDLLSNMRSGTPFPAKKKTKNKEKICYIADGLWGMLDEQGEVIIPPKYNYISDFSNGIAFALKGNLWGAINPKGDTLIPFLYKKIEFLPNTNNQFIKVYRDENLWGLAKLPDVILTDGVYDKIILGDDNIFVLGKTKKLMLADSLGHPVSIIYKDIRECREGMAPFRGKNNRYGFLDQNGTEVIPGKYTSAEAFYYGKAAVSLNNKAGYVNHNGEEIIPLQFSWAGNFYKNVAIVEKNSKKGLINQLGEWIIHPQFDKLEMDTIAQIIYAHKKEKMSVYDFSGQKLSHNYDHLYKKEGAFISFKRGKKVGVLGSDYKPIFEITADDIDVFVCGHAPVKQGKNWGVVNAQGKAVVPFQYKSCSPFKHNVACVKGEKDKMFSLIDTSGNVLNGVNSRRIFKFINGRALIEWNGEYNYIDSNGVKLSDKGFTAAKDFAFGYGVAKKENYGIINAYGNEINAFHYKDIKLLSNKYFTYKVPEKVGLYNNTGKALIEADYETETLINSRLIKVEGQNKIGYFDITTGTWFWEMQN